MVSQQESLDVNDLEFDCEHPELDLEFMEDALALCQDLIHFANIRQSAGVAVVLNRLQYTHYRHYSEIEGKTPLQSIIETRAPLGCIKPVVDFLLKNAPPDQLDPADRVAMEPFWQRDNLTTTADIIRATPNGGMESADEEEAVDAAFIL